jgi:hypothetical protein
VLSHVAITNAVDQDCIQLMLVFLVLANPESGENWASAPKPTGKALVSGVGGKDAVAGSDTASRISFRPA